ncbi:MAG: CRISPR-associated helicase Cas3' [Deltaproteobacteria bacterium]|nr:CRISPR-associated helicase Cas3' [Deltaproteobacteria bacterium]
MGEHLEEVARLAGQAASAFGFEEWGRLAGLWHDLGKYRNAFQRYLRGELPSASHKWAGAAHAVSLPHKAAAQLIALCIAGHHGGLPAWASGDRPATSHLSEAQQELDEALSGKVPPDLLAPPSIGVPPEATTILRRMNATDRQLYMELLARFLFSALVDGDYADTSAYYAPAEPAQRRNLVNQQASIPVLLARLDNHMAVLSARAPDTAVNRERRVVLGACRRGATQPPGVFDLCVPTGGGKTLSAMLFALAHAREHRLRRVIVTLPYTSIIEQNAAVYADVLGPENVLEHHSAWEEDDNLSRPGQSMPSASLRRQKLLTENWNSPVIITTSVQLLESLHANRAMRCRKLHNIAQSVIILDEVQTLPPHLLDATLDTLRTLVAGFGCSVVACTATQPALGRCESALTGRLTHERLGNIRSIVPDAAQSFTRLSRVRVRWPTDLAVPTSYESLASEAGGERQVLIVTHRRRDARDLARLLGNDALHLSASMLPAHRSRVIADIKGRLSRAEPCRVVATQVVEAGVDLDFPVVYRALAGVDSLAQAAGRCNREGRLRAKGEFRIFVAPTPPPRGVLELALAVTRKLASAGVPNLDDPALYRRFYEALYDLSDTDARGLTGLRSGAHSDFPEIAARYRLIESGWQIPVIVPWLGLPERVRRDIDRLRHGYTDGDALRRIRRATVNVERRLVGEWLGEGIVAMPKDFALPILALETFPTLYDDRLGLDYLDTPSLKPEDLVL